LANLNLLFFSSILSFFPTPIFSFLAFLTSRGLVGWNCSRTTPCWLRLYRRPSAGGLEGSTKPGRLTRPRGGIVSLACTAWRKQAQFPPINCNSCNVYSYPFCQFFLPYRAMFSLYHAVFNASNKKKVRMLTAKLALINNLYCFWAKMLNASNNSTSFD
jgi:hypothetical protein